LTWKRLESEFLRGLANNPIEEIYLKRFGKIAPDKVFSIEETAREQQQEQAARKERKRQAREAKEGDEVEQGG
jgi:hypothetical protein